MPAEREEGPVLVDGDVQVIAPAVGGGFGAKVAVFMEDLVVPAVSRILGRPVKWIEDRYEHLATTGHSKEMTCDLDGMRRVPGS